MTAIQERSTMSQHVLEPTARPVETPACAACPHPVDEHDAIAQRFCRATAVGALDRGCVCRIG